MIQFDDHIFQWGWNHQLGSNGKWTRIEDVFPIENGDIPM